MGRHPRLRDAGRQASPCSWGIQIWSSCRYEYRACFATTVAESRCNTATSLVRKLGGILFPPPRFGDAENVKTCLRECVAQYFLQKGGFLRVAEGTGLEPASPCGRRFSRPLHYQLCDPSAAGKLYRTKRGKQKAESRKQKAGGR